MKTSRKMYIWVIPKNSVKITKPWKFRGGIKLGWAAFGGANHIFKSKIPNNLKRAIFSKCVLPVMACLLDDPDCAKSIPTNFGFFKERWK